jgi:cell division protein FtsB
MRTSLAYLRRISPMQILLLLVLTVALYFATAFTGELIASHRVDQQLASLNADIDRLTDQNKHLKNAVAEASSDAYVERQAREELGLVRAGDIPVVVSNAPPPAPAPTPAAPAARAHWEKWRDLLAAPAP